MLIALNSLRAGVTPTSAIRRDALADELVERLDALLDIA